MFRLVQIFVSKPFREEPREKENWRPREDLPSVRYVQIVIRQIVEIVIFAARVAEQWCGEVLSRKSPK